jgi:hypothetical protein
VSSLPGAAAAQAWTEAATADAIAAAVAQCPAVASLHGGGLRRTATYLPGRLVEGVHVDEDRVRVAVVAAQGLPVGVLAEQIRAAVVRLAPGRAVDVHVADLQLTDVRPPASQSGPPA